MGDRDQLVNFGTLSTWKRLGNLVTGGMRTHRVSIAVFALIFVVVGGTAGKLLPKTFSTQARLLVKKNYVMPALVNPKRAVPSGYEAAAQSADTSVMSRGSLEGIIKSNDLLARWDRDRPSVLRVKDRIMGLITGPLHDDDKRDVLVEVLAKRISVSVNDDIVTVKATWTDQQTACDLVNSAVNAFLDSRRRLDVQTIADTYEILKRSAEKERAKVDEQLLTVEDRQRASIAGKLALLRRPASQLGATAGPTDDGLGGLRDRIRSAHLALADADKRHRDQVDAVTTKLTERRAALKANHPDIVELESTLARVKAEPAELKALRSTEAGLLSDYSARGGQGLPYADPIPVAVPTAAPARPADGAPTELPKDLEDDATVYARSLFKGSMENYQDLLARLKDTQLELETAESAFRYRYQITSPARLPKKADAPNVPLIVIGSLLAGLMGGIVRAIFKELSAQSLLTMSALSQYLSAPPAPPVAA